MPMVVTMFSLALKPEMEAATGANPYSPMPQPRGWNRGAMNPPTTPMRLSALSSTMPNPSAVNPKVDSTHITTHARKRMVPAFLMKLNSLSHTWMATVRMEGMW